MIYSLDSYWPLNWDHHKSMAFLRFCIFALLHQSDIQYRILIIRPWDIRWCTTASQPNRLVVKVCAPLHLCCMGVSLTWRLTPPKKNPPPWCHGWHVARYTHTTLCLTFFLFSHTLLFSSHPFAHQRMSAALLFFFRKIFFFLSYGVCVRWDWNYETNMRSRQ